MVRKLGYSCCVQLSCAALIYLHSICCSGIDAREEFEVLHYSQLIQTRKLVFPDAPPYPAGRRAALTHLNHPKKIHLIGMPPPQPYHRSDGQDAPSVASGITFEGGTMTQPLNNDQSVEFLKQPIGVDFTHVDEELGEALPLDDVKTNRESVFQDERNWFGVDGDAPGLRHRRNRSAFSVETLYGAGGGGGRSGGSGGNNPSEEGGGGGRANSSHSPTPSSGGYHRRTSTNNSIAGLMPSKSAFRLPDV